MDRAAREATLLSLGVFGVVLSLGLTRFGWGVGYGVVGVVFTAAVVWLGVYATGKLRGSDRF